MSDRRLGQAIFPAAVIFVVAMMVIPLPTQLLDLLLTLNIAAGVLLLLASMNVRKPLDLAVFPSLLLVATLFRLGLNISSTRLILSKGDAGEVIEAFGNFVISGSLVVGLVVFLILVVIQFVVITNGATRVAEVGARFTLDAMPGKQMAIDADLNAGVIDDEEARRRREEISSEADFYGAMDGASKFVKGDAIASVIITIINLVGGLVIGVVQLGVPVGEAVSRYSLLTVGDGLVSQIPALLVSISAGLIVTRSAGESDLGSDVFAQFAAQHHALRTGGIALVLVGFVPGLPTVPFVVVGGATLVVSRRLAARAAAVEAAAHDDRIPPPPDPDDPNELMRSMRVEPVSLELAVDLVDLVDVSAGGDLLDRVRGLRRKLALELGMIVPPVRTRDNLDLPLGSYVVRVHGVEVGRGTAPPGQVLVLADDLAALPGVETREAVFGLPAKWVPTSHRAHAEAVGGTVVDRASVITTHLAEICRRHAPELLSRQEVKGLLDVVRRTDPAVVEDLTNAQVGVGEIQLVLQGLLAEQVSIRDLVRILDGISQRARHTRDTEQLVEAARTAIGSAIAVAHAPDGVLAVLTLDPMLEQALLASVQQGEDGRFLAIDPDQAERLGRACAERLVAAEQTGRAPVLVCAPALRPALRRYLSRVLPQLPLLSYEELSDHLTIETLGTVSLEHALEV
ncbi:flagellar biosynthesis protein FlhA [Actinomarinicola tropica]|uniref:Flagellar biosynthesis protein FlhA n=1 Tax=Actinomarinicola tropica TaxID=2789776 RepID=A0A5Q2RCP4_9ACTN|nr:flagellar biosynthesis protein FlhA [Actinomarinicola tropica]QGG94659.1 flagellar biosynthesis protein FlhA [Actinomarinicola tropica]